METTRRERLRAAPGGAIAFLCFVAVLAGCGKPGGGAAANGPLAGTDASKASNAAIAKTIQDRIAADSELKGMKITASAQEGTISLDGAVKDQAQKDKAEAIVFAVQKENKLQTGVTDHLMIEESGAAGTEGTGAGAKGNGGR